MHTPRRLLLTGGTGFLGSHVLSELRERWPSCEIIIPQRPQDDLLDRAICERLVQGIDTVIHLAARVGGIGYNRENPATLVYENTVMGFELLEAARKAGVEKYVVVGTVCMYPKFTSVPFHEEDIWNGYPEETNAPYGLAKKLLFVQAEAYRAQYGMNTVCLLPVNLYGPGDNVDPASSHVIPALIRKMIEARDHNKPEVEVWGTGAASREFCYVQDTARAIVLATERYEASDPINIGNGSEIVIRDLVELIRRLVGYEGKIVWNASKPDGQPRRCLDVTKAEQRFGFRAGVELEEGLRKTIDWYESQ